MCCPQSFATIFRSFMPSLRLLAGRQGSTEHMVVKMFRLVTDNGVNQILSMQFWALVSCLTQT